MLNHGITPICTGLVRVKRPVYDATRRTNKQPFTHSFE